MKAYLFPGQGSQYVGMGEKLFDAFPDLVAIADEILEYSIKDLCLLDADKQLAQTRYTQPALYVVNALTYRQKLNEDTPAAYLAGHSLGEYNALESAGVFSFEEGLKLVKKRGELMSKAPKGAMAAIIGITSDKIREILSENDLTAIDIANYNAYNQTIISGLQQDIQNSQTFFEKNQAMFIPLNVSGAFHSRYMQPARDEFKQYLESFTFSIPHIPIIANINALPYESSQVSSNLADQLTHSVYWLDSMHFLLEKGITEFVELGPGDVLTKLIKSIKARFKPIVAPSSNQKIANTSNTSDDIKDQNFSKDAKPEQIITKTAQQMVDEWNKSFAVGIKVKVKGYAEPLITKTQAVILFGHRAAIYMQGYNGYFALDEIEPAKETITID